MNNNKILDGNEGGAMYTREANHKQKEVKQREGVNYVLDKVKMTKSFLVDFPPSHERM